MKHPDGLESASKRPLWGIRTHSATSPKRLPEASGAVTGRFFCGRQPRHLVAPLSSEGMPLLAVELADNRTSCPAVAKTCDCLQVAGAAKLFLALFPCQTPKNRELCPLRGLVGAKNRLFCPRLANTGDSSRSRCAARSSRSRCAARSSRSQSAACSLRSQSCSTAVVCNHAAPMSLLAQSSCAAYHGRVQNPAVLPALLS